MKAGIPKPRMIRKYKLLAQKRLNIKKNYESIRNDRNKSEGLGQFLAIMGHAISSSSAEGRLGEKKE